MEKISFYQQAFLRSAEKLLGAEAETRKMLERLAWEKAEAVAKKIIGKTFDATQLISTVSYYYKDYKGYDYKAVFAEGSVVDNFVDNITDNHRFYKNDSLLYVSVLFMRDPNEVPGIKLTDKEKSCLKALSWFWDRVKDGENPHYKTYGSKSIYDIHRELCELKNNLHLVYDLQWSYSLQDITSSNFLSCGLRAVANLC